MNRLLIPALAVSLSLHAGIIVFVPTGHGWGASNPAQKPALHASLHLPKNSAKVATTGRPQAPAETHATDTPRELPSEAEVTPVAEPAPPSGFGLPLPEVSRAYEGAELTKRPAALDALPADLDESLPPGSTGRAILVLEIDDKGAVIDITPENSELDPASLTKIAEAFQGMRFLPGRIGKVPVRTRMRIEVSIDDWPGDLGGKDR